MIDFNRFKHIQFNFYFGIDAMHLPAIKRSENVRSKVFRHEDILKNDLLITAFGVSAYEFIALGMPVVGFGHSDETTRAAQVFAEKTGGMRCLGHIDGVEPNQLNDEIQLVNQELEVVVGIQRIGRQASILNGLEHVTRVIEETCKSV